MRLYRYFDHLYPARNSMARIVDISGHNRGAGYARSASISGVMQVVAATGAILTSRIPAIGEMVLDELAA